MEEKILLKRRFVQPTIYGPDPMSHSMTDKMYFKIQFCKRKWALLQLTLIMQKIIKKTLMGAFLGTPPKMHCITLCKWSWLTLVTS